MGAITKILLSTAAGLARYLSAQVSATDVISLTDDTTGNAPIIGGGIKIGDATNNIHFDADGTLRLSGTATTFADMLGSVTAIKVLGTGVSLNDAEQTIDFTTAADLSDYAWVSSQFHHEWKRGSSAHPHIHAVQTSAAVPNLLVRYRWQRNNAAHTTAWTDYKCNTEAFSYTSGNFNQIYFGAGITPPSGYSISDILQIRVFRDNANTSGVFTGADPIAATLAITSIDTHIEKDDLGSASEYVK